MVKRFALRAFGIWVALFTLLAGCATDMATLQKRLEPGLRMHRPDGQGPFAAVMLVPGCAGVAPGRIRTAEQLTGRGYVTVFVDYLSSRGLQSACRGEVRLDEVAGDIRAVGAYLPSLPYIRPDAVGIVGWSWGGAGILETLAEAGPNQQAPFKAAAALYPVCSQLQPWKATVPVLVFLGELDDVAPAAACRELVQSIGQASPVTVRTYPRARHAFDLTDLPAVTAFPGSSGKTVGYNADAAREAWREITALFDRELRK